MTLVQPSTASEAELQLRMRWKTADGGDGDRLASQKGEQRYAHANLMVGGRCLDVWRLVVEWLHSRSICTGYSPVWETCARLLLKTAM